jgi:hypothetical protein
MLMAARISLKEMITQSMEKVTKYKATIIPSTKTTIKSQAVITQ